MMIAQSLIRNTFKSTIVPELSAEVREREIA